MRQIPQAATTGVASSSTAFRALAPVFFYIGIAGVVTVMLGPLLPALIQHWHIQDAQAGTLFAVTFAGQFCGAWFAANNLRASILYGALLTAAGCAAMVYANFGTAHIALFCVGLGLGAGLTAANVIAGTVLPSARARLLGLLNVAWSAGAIACPILVRLCGPDGLRPFFFLTSAALALAAVFAIFLPHKATFPIPQILSIPQPKPAKSRIPLPAITSFLFVAAMLLYVGIENALGGWLPSYAIRVNPSANASNIAMYFWTAELVGRLLMAIPIPRLGEAALYRVSAALLLLTEMTLLASPHLSPSSIIALTILSGFTLAPLYPLIIAFLLARTGNHPRLGPLFAVASLGGAILPWFTGVVSTQLHGLRAGLTVPAIGVVLLLLLSSGIIPTPPAKAEAPA